VRVPGRTFALALCPLGLVLWGCAAASASAADPPGTTAPKPIPMAARGDTGGSGAGGSGAGGSGAGSVDGGTDAEDDDAAARPDGGVPPEAIPTGVRVPKLPPADPLEPPAVQAGCYTEPLMQDRAIADLVSAFTGTNWFDTATGVLGRRYAPGGALLTDMQDEPNLPRFLDPGTTSGDFGALSSSLMTMCHEETHVWDGENSTASTYAFYVSPDVTLHGGALESFPRSEILALIDDDTTRTYDDTYLSGDQGTYGFDFLADELGAYTNGLACIAAVGDQVGFEISARDGAVAHLYYLELYLHVARTNHPEVYTAITGDPDWVQFIRTEWARVAFLTQASSVYPNLGIDDGAIWQKVRAPENLMEIQLALQDDPRMVACKP
jgi:hypothetical protein